MIQQPGKKCNPRRKSLSKELQTAKSRAILNYLLATVFGKQLLYDSRLSSKSRAEPGGLVVTLFNWLEDPARLCLSHTLAIVGTKCAS